MRRSCWVELTLNSSPASCWTSASSLRASKLSSSLIACSLHGVDGDAGHLHLGEHPDERAFHLVVESRGAGLVQCLADPRHEAGQHRHLLRRGCRVLRHPVRLREAAPRRLAAGEVEPELFGDRPPR